MTFVPSPRSGYRLNLVLPTADPARIFGGIRTALDLFDAIGPADAERRIVTVGRMDADLDTAVPGYRGMAPGDDPDDPDGRRQLVALRPPLDALAVRPTDVFIATFWTTAELVGRIRAWQASTYGAAPARFGYVIQDFEPGFYPFSAQWSFARATYDHAAETVAMCNTSLLRDDLAARGIHFDRTFAFEPRMHPGLRATMARPAEPRSRTIVVYGRPGTPRNGFPAIVDALRAWVARDPNAATWQVVSVGRTHPDIDLGRGVSMRSIGKLDIDAYGALLRGSAIGISLMFSPHPSYPPLEMAHLGMLVLTNRFGAKDLSSWHANIRSVGDGSADALAAELTQLCRRFEADPTVGETGTAYRPDFLSDDPAFPFADEVAALLRDGATGLAAAAVRQDGPATGRVRP